MTYVADETRRGLLFAATTARENGGHPAPAEVGTTPPGSNSSRQRGMGPASSTLPSLRAWSSTPVPAAYVMARPTTTGSSSPGAPHLSGSFERTLPAEPIPTRSVGDGESEFREFIAETPGPTVTRDVHPGGTRNLPCRTSTSLTTQVGRGSPHRRNRWELFDNEGRLLGTFPVRPRKEDAAPAFGPDHLVTIRQDSLDLDHVDVWRIDPGRQ